MGKRRYFKFGIQVYRRVPAYERQTVPERGVVTSRDRFKFLVPVHISGMAEARAVKFYT